MMSNLQGPIPVDPPDHQGFGRLVDDLMVSEARLLAVHTPEVDRVVEQFRHVVRKTGRSVYLWTEDRGMVSLKEGNVEVPGCKRLIDALRYVLQSMHFGVYLFVDAEHQMRQGSVLVLRQISRARAGHDRRVILLGQDLRLPSVLDDSVTHFTHHQLVPTRPRLRDGRWVLG